MSAETGNDRRENQPGTERLLTLSDGVVAIALTLLVLQLKVPSLAEVDKTSAARLASALADETSQFVSYVISFYVIAQFWLAHHRVFRRVAGHGENLAWWNFAFLFTITVMPFTSNLLGDYPDNPLAVDIFALNLLIASLTTSAILVFGRHRWLVEPDPDPLATRAIRVRTAAIAIVVLISIAVAWVSTSTAKYIWILIAIAPWLARRWLARHGQVAQERPAGQA